MVESRLFFSFDYELKWGVIDYLNDNYNKNILGASPLVENCINYFAKNNLSWNIATLPIMYAGSAHTLKTKYPQTKALNRYISDSKTIFQMQNAPALYFAPQQLLRQLLQSDLTYVSLHGYTHMAMNDLRRNEFKFQDELEAAMSTGYRLGLDLRSYVFPLNMYSCSELQLLCARDVQFVRGGDSPSKNMGVKIRRHLANIFNTNLHKTAQSYMVNNLTVHTNGHFLRNYKSRILRYLYSQKIYDFVQYSVMNDRDLHIWCHPHNFGCDQGEFFRLMDVIKLAITDIGHQPNSIFKKFSDCFHD